MSVEASDPRLTDAREALGLRTLTRLVRVDAASAPVAGQVLTATADDAADWQAPSGGGSGLTHPQVMTRAAWGF